MDTDMPVCDRCGEEIEFRWVDGNVRPIHVSGGWCPGSSRRNSSPSRSAFQTVQSYLDPNARCPVCGASVFFYRSPHNGRVFFDDVGWPWPKHPCTDKYRGRDGQIVKPTNIRMKFHFRSRDGKLLDVFRIEEMTGQTDRLLIWLRKAEDNSSIVIAIARAAMREKRITKEDIQQAPGLVLPRDKKLADQSEVSFISARHQSVITIAVSVVES